MASRRDDDWRVDRVWVHARLGVVVERHEGPVGDYTSDTHGMRVGGRGRGTRKQVFDAGGVKELDVGEGEDLGEERGCEEGLT